MPLFFLIWPNLQARAEILQKLLFASEIIWPLVYTVLHFINERGSPRFLPCNQIKIILVKELYFWLTAFFLANDTYGARNWNISIFSLFFSHVFVILRSHHWHIQKLQIIFHDVSNSIFKNFNFSFKHLNCGNHVTQWSNKQ